MSMIFALFLIAGNHPRKTSKTFLQPRKKSLSEESLKEKRKTFCCYVFPFDLVQYENTEFMS